MTRLTVTLSPDRLNIMLRFKRKKRGIKCRDISTSGIRHLCQNAFLYIKKKYIYITRLGEEKKDIAKGEIPCFSLVIAPRNKGGNT